MGNLVSVKIVCVYDYKNNKNQQISNNDNKDYEVRDESGSKKEYNNKVNYNYQNYYEEEDENNIKQKSKNFLRCTEHESFKKKRIFLDQYKKTDNIGIGKQYIRGSQNNYKDAFD